MRRLFSSFAVTVQVSDEQYVTTGLTITTDEQYVMTGLIILLYIFIFTSSLMVAFITDVQRNVAAV